MNCKHCGTKLGILERWRYADFCSQGHKDDYAEDVARLNEQIVKDLRRIPNRLKGEPEGLTECPAPLEPGEEPAPPEAGFVLAPDSEPLCLAVEPAEPDPPPPARAKGDQWRLFAKMADWSQLPVGILAASQKRQLRFVWVAFAGDSVPGQHGALLSGEYPAFLPRPELRRWQAHLQMALHSEPSAIVAPAAPLAIEAQQYWVDDQGWRWIPEGAAVNVPDFGPVLSEYPVAAPWLDWTVGAGHTPRTSPTPPMAASQPGQPRPPVRPHGGHAEAVPPGVSGAAGQPAGLANYSPANAPGVPVPPSWRGDPAAQPLRMPVPAWPGGPAWAGGMVGYAPHHSAIPPVPSWSMGLVWQELPPPLFNALVDPSHALRPLPGVIAHQVPPTGNLTAHLPKLPLRPTDHTSLFAGFSLIDCQGDPLEDVAPAGAQPVHFDWQPRTLWRRLLAMPIHAARTPQPAIPRYAAPPLGLRSRPLPPAPTGVPVLYSGRWID